MDEFGTFGSNFCYVMVDYDPIGPIKPLLEGQIRYPPGSFPQFPLTPIIKITGLESHFTAEQLSRKPLQQNSGHQTVEIALVGDDHFWLGQRLRHSTENKATP